MKQYIVDAFTAEPFAGNPAAVCVMDSWPADQDMMNLAMENNLSETAFIVKEEQGYHLRWFTPGTEVELCGHATLASSFVIFKYYESDEGQIQFTTLSGVLTVNRRGERYEMDFPVCAQEEIPVTDAMERAFGARPVRALMGTDLLCVFKDEQLVRDMQPDQALLAELPGRLQNVTAPGSETDCVSRSFGPKVAVPEDPVCGSAHCQIAEYWSVALDRREIEAYQASRRGGYLHCVMKENGRIAISGEAVLVAVSDIAAEPFSGK